MHPQQLFTALQLCTIKTDRLQNLFDLIYIADMEHWFAQFHVAKVPGTFGHATRTGGTFKVAIIGSKTQV